MIVLRTRAASQMSAAKYDSSFYILNSFLILISTFGISQSFVPIKKDEEPYSNTRNAFDQGLSSSSIPRSHARKRRQIRLHCRDSFGLRLLAGFEILAG